MNALKDMKLDQVFDDLRSQATKRIDEMLTDGRKQARKAGGGHDDTALFSAFTLGHPRRRDRRRGCRALDDPVQRSAGPREAERAASTRSARTT